MGRIDDALPSALQRNVARDHRARLQDPDLVGQALHFQPAPPRGLRHAVENAAHPHHALMRDPPFQAEHRPIGMLGQLPQFAALLREGLADDPPGRGVPARKRGAAPT